MMRTAVLVLAFAVLGGCGFTPLYGSGGQSAAGAIDIPEIQGRTGHFLRQELVRTLSPGIPGLAGGGRLEVKIGEHIERLAFTPDQAASRSDYIGAATYTLTRADGVVAATGTVQEAASFNFADAAYADIAAQTAAQERLASLLARSIRQRLIIQVGNAPPPQPAAAPSAPSAPAPATPTP